MKQLFLFERGDQNVLKMPRTTYIMLGKNIADITLTALYGITKYEKNEKQNLTYKTGYELAKNLNLDIGYAFTNEDKDDLNATDLQQFNALLHINFKI